MIDFNTEPYNDDFDEAKKFYRILYRPSFAVQARELTQMQSILQNQIKRFGDSVFQQGAMVIPGQASILTSTQPGKGLSYVKLQALYNGVAVETFLSNLNGATVIGQQTGLTAQVVLTQSQANGDPTTIYVNYTNSGSNNTDKVFQDGEVITTSDGTYSFQAIGTYISGANPTATGLGSSASIAIGVYYFNGYFCLCEPQTILLDKYDNTPSYKIGLIFSEQIITPEEDSTLLDNAQNSYNYAAPGAHRYYIELKLVKYGLNDTTDKSFIELIRVTDGAIFTLTNTTAYSGPSVELARRTYDQAGNYTVTDFLIDVRENRNNNRGQWTPNTAYLIDDVVTNNGYTYVAQNSGTSVTTAPTQTVGTSYDGPSNTGINWLYTDNPNYNRGIYLNGDPNSLSIGLEAGKAYVQGYEISKVNTTYLTVPKPRTTVQLTASIIPGPDDVGNYVLVKNISGLPPIDTYAQVTLYDTVTSTLGTVPSGGTAVGTARIRYIEYHSGDVPYDQSTVYKLGLFNVQMNQGKSFYDNVKQFTYTGTGFTADVYPTIEKLTGSISISGTAVTGVGTSFQTDLNVGDTIIVNPGSAQSYVKVSAINSQTSITLAAAGPTVSGVAYAEFTATILEPNTNSLIFPLPYYGINSIRSSTGANTLSYTCYEKYTSTAASGVVTFTTSSGTFSSYAGIGNYVFMDNTTGLAINPTISQVTISGTNLTVSGVTNGHTYSVVGAVIRTGTGNEKSKTLNTVSVTYNTASTAQAPIITLPNADVYRIISIKQADGQAWGSSPTSTQWVTSLLDNYQFNNGQTNEYYGLGSLILKTSYNAPTAPIQVTYQYFSHGQGDFFTVNSYSSIGYTDIPPNLRDAIDFRPRVADYAVGQGTVFVGTGASYTPTPKRGIDLAADYSYYLPRTDKIALDINGNFFDIQGVPSLTPAAPADPSNGMVIYSVAMEPYVYNINSSSVSPTKVENQRYTMLDIGKLEKRINNLEYYTSLSLLEQSTQSMQTTDSSGLNRFKNGFIVDNFSGNNIGDTNNVDYFCSIDMANNQLRPFYTADNINLVELNSNNAQRAASNYQITGDIITLPYTTTPFITQQFASQLENINPFAIFSFLGVMNLNPPNDDWFEVNQLPDVIQTVMGNYNTMLAISEKAGILGTVWNAWQTQWTGVPVTTGDTTYIADKRGVGVADSRGWGTVSNISDAALSALVGPGSAGALGGWAHRIVKVETTATPIGQTRTGTQTSIELQTDYQVVGNNIVSTAVIPYIRSRHVLVQVHGLKPSTKFYPYFDGIAVDSYCTPSAKMVYTVTSGTFDYKTNVGASVTDVARQIDGDTQVCLNLGDVVKGATSGATAVVVNTYIDYSSNNALVMELVNIKGTFITNEVITGSVSNAVGNVTSISIPSTTDLITNKLGQVNFLFDIPNNSTLSFRTGSREFKLLDVNTYAGQYTSRAASTYVADGTLETKQKSVNAVQNAQIVQEQVTANQTIYSVANNVLSDTGWFDPLAESFYISSPGGAFLTSIDVFFASKDSNIPVTLSMRNMVDGSPGSLTLPFSTVTLTPDQVNLSSNSVTLPDGSSWPSYDTATRFTFESPVYVEDQTEYCFVLRSDSNAYNVWVSNMGDTVPGTDTVITEQPYAGVMFLSQNASTWTPDQNRDIKFTINRAVFNTNVVGNVQFTNDQVPLSMLETNPFQTGVGTNSVRVWHYDHGMPPASMVTIDGLNAAQNLSGTITTSVTSNTVSGTGTSFTTQLVVGSCLYDNNMTLIGQVAAIANNTTLTLTANATEALSSYTLGNFINPLNGIPASQILGTHSISNVLKDSYTITSTTNATIAGYVGGNGYRASKNIKFDVINPTVQMQTFPLTTSTFSVKTTSGQSISGSETPYVVDSNFSPCLTYNNNNFTAPRIIASKINETTYLSGAKSLTFSAQLTTSNDAVSPVIDTTRTSMIAISNSVNVPNPATTDLAVLDILPVFTGATGAFSFSGNTITSTNYAVRAALATIPVGSYVVISGATTSSNSQTVLVTGYSDTNPGNFASGSSGTGTLTVSGTFTSEAGATGTTVSYKQLFVDEIAPTGSSTISKYVTTPIKLAAQSTYTRVMFGANIPTQANVLVYYKTCLGDSSQLATTPYTLLTPDAGTLPNVQFGDPSFTDVTYTAQNTAPYDTIVVKIVLQSTNTCAVPKLKDFRVISCA
jgi:hypothetical protein